MDTLNSPSTEQEPTSQEPSSGDSPVDAQDGAGDQTQKRVDDLMGLANRRLTAQQRAEAERDAARAEVEALRASMDEAWDTEREGYWQVESAPPAAASVEQQVEGEPPEPARTVIDPNMAPRRSPVSQGGTEVPLAAVRADFDAWAAVENQRLRALKDDWG